MTLRRYYSFSVITEPMLSQEFKIEEDPTFFLQDRFGILGGVYPPDRCALSSTKQRARVT